MFDSRDRPRLINRQNNYYSVPKGVTKILILGSGSVGKSAVFKSIRRIYNGPLTEAEFTNGKCAIRSNIVAGILTLLKQSDQLYNHNPNDPELSKCFINLDDETIEAIKLIVNYGSEYFIEDKDDPGYHPLNYEEIKSLGEAIDQIWKLSGVQKVFELRLKQYYSFPANMDYFFDKVNECMDKNYMPTEEDILRVRIRTTGYIEANYEIKENWYMAIDVGGERNERKKWIHSFPNTDCILFVASLKQYCRAMFEDEKRIGLLENLELFYEICNSKWFPPHRITIVLLLNHKDLFKKSLKITPLTFCFGDEYKGRNYDDVFGKDDMEFVMRFMKRALKLLIQDVEDLDDVPLDVLGLVMQYFEVKDWWLELCYKDGVEFIRNKYLELIKKTKYPNRVVLVHETCAIKPFEDMEKVLWDVHDRLSKRSQTYASIL